MASNQIDQRGQRSFRRRVPGVGDELGCGGWSLAFSSGGASGGSLARGLRARECRSPEGTSDAMCSCYGGAPVTSSREVCTAPERRRSGPFRPL